MMSPRELKIYVRCPIPTEVWVGAALLPRNLTPPQRREAQKKIIRRYLRGRKDGEVPALQVHSPELTALIEEVIAEN